MGAERVFDEEAQAFVVFDDHDLFGDTHTAGRMICTDVPLCSSLRRLIFPRCDRITLFTKLNPRPKPFTSCTSPERTRKNFSNTLVRMLRSMPMPSSTM